MFVYFITTQGCKPRMMKIGKAKNVESRLAELQCASPFELELRGTLRCASEKNAYAVEEALHYAFQGYRRRGEWFLYTLEVKYAIASIIAAEITGSAKYFGSHLFKTRGMDLQQMEREEAEAQNINNALDREFRAIIG